MPSAYSSSPFLSLRPDQECGRSKTVQGNGKSFSSLSGAATPSANGHANGHVQTSLNGNDEFLKLDAPQQDLLLLHGPRQKYKLEGSRDLPELQGDREILVQVLAIGLNPTDWKGADYGYGQPSYPWVNGRDFAGIVVRTARNASRIKQGDVVFGASTDYRDIRKAAYQEYVVANDYNVTRIPQGVSVKEGAALGVAYVAALVSLGVSFGLDLTRLRNAPAGPDLVGLTRSLDPRDVPQDIRDEIFSGIPVSERPQPGEWIAIWGANSMTGRIALQLAKHAGLKVAAVGDIARGGAHLSELGADFMVDKYDEKRAIDILKAVTGGKLRFGIDCNGKDTATSLQQALSQSDNGYKSHLLGLSGMPKDVGRGVVHHQVPIKIFHEAPQVGEAMSVWLEELLVHHALKLPEVEIADGGLAGINDALDRMRTGKISGKRIVVPVGQDSKSGVQSPSNGHLPNGIRAASSGETADLSYADSLNYDPERLRFAYWVPNVSGGLVISKIKQRTHWDMNANIRYARIAEQNGFEYALSQIRFMAGYGAENQHEPVSLSLAMMLATERLKVIAALLPGPWNPAVAAKMIASIDQYTEGRVCVNVVSGWFRAEFASIGQWWLDHAERYRRSREFIQCLKGIWTQDTFTFKGDFYQFHDYPLKPKPMNLPGRPYPEIFQGGNSDDAKDNAASVSDYYFMNGNTLEGFQKQISDVKERAKKNGREGEVGFALNAFVICRETEEEAIRTLQEIQGKADKEAVEGFRQQVQNAGSSTGNKSGMWANSKFEDLVQYNDGFKTKLIGTKEQIAERIVLLKSLGVNIILTAFLHYEEEIEHFGKEVLPLVRELERQGRGKDQAYEIEQTGHIYAEKKNSERSCSVDQIAPTHTSVQDSTPTLHAHIFRKDLTGGGSTIDQAQIDNRANEKERKKTWAPPSWKTNNEKSFASLTAVPPVVAQTWGREAGVHGVEATTEDAQQSDRNQEHANQACNPSTLNHTHSSAVALPIVNKDDTANLATAYTARPNPSLPAAEEALARAREMLDVTKAGLLTSGEGSEDDLRAFMGEVVAEVGTGEAAEKERANGNVGIQWEEPDDWEEKEDVDGEKPGQGNVGTQWDDPPDVVKETASAGRYARMSQAREERIHEEGNSSRSIITGPGQGNVGIQWEEPPDQEIASLLINHDVLLSSLGAVEQTPDPSMNLKAEAPTRPQKLKQAEQTAPELSWDPVSETFTQQGNPVTDPNTMLPVEMLTSPPANIVAPPEEPAVHGDLDMLIGSKEGDIPEGMVWDPVNESLSQQTQELDKAATKKVEFKREEPENIPSKEEGDIKVAEEHLASAKNETQKVEGSGRTYESSVVSPSQKGDVTRQSSVKDAGSRLKSSGRDSQRSDGGSSLRKSLDGSQKERGLLSKIKRTVSKVRWHSDDVR